MVHGLSLAPFARRADWDMTGRGTIIMSNGETYQLREFSQDGQLLRTIDGPELERRAVPRAERADSIRALEARIDSLPVPLDDVQNVAPEILQGEIPDSLPAFISLHVGASDRIWVERWPRKAWPHHVTTMSWNTTGATWALSSCRPHCWRIHRHSSAKTSSSAWLSTRQPTCTRSSPSAFDCRDEIGPSRFKAGQSPLACAFEPVDEPGSQPARSVRLPGAGCCEACPNTGFTKSERCPNLEECRPMSSSNYALAQGAYGAAAR